MRQNDPFEEKYAREQKGGMSEDESEEISKSKIESSEDEEDYSDSEVEEVIDKNRLLGNKAVKVTHRHKRFNHTQGKGKFKASKTLLRAKNTLSKFGQSYPGKKRTLMRTSQQYRTSTALAIAIQEKEGKDKQENKRSKKLLSQQVQKRK